MSTEDIPKGSAWMGQLIKALGESSFGIICVTPTNQASPWLVLETGGIVAKYGASYACPYLFRMKPTDLTKTPLQELQATMAEDEKETKRLMKTMRSALKELGEPVESETLFEQRWSKFWPDLQGRLKKIPKSKTHTPGPKSSDDKLEDIYQRVLELSTRDSTTTRLTHDIEELKRLVFRGKAARSLPPKWGRAGASPIIGEDRVCVKCHKMSITNKSFCPHCSTSYPS